MLDQIPKAEINIDAQLVKQLIDTQFPAFSHLPIRFLDSGWDNENYRLGADYLLRMPRRAVAAALIEQEIAWLPKLQKQLPIAIPAPLHIGAANSFFPWRWTICPWFDGTTANKTAPAEGEAVRFAHFLKALHSTGVENAPVNPSRSISLSQKDKDTKLRMERLKLKTNAITTHIEKIWEAAIQEPQARHFTMIHGDLHPKNVVVNDGKIAAVIDWGDICSGDIANDISAFWMLFKDKNEREHGLAAYKVEPSLRNRAMGWAVFLGIVLLDTGLNSSNEEYAAIGRSILGNMEGEAVYT